MEHIEGIDICVCVKEKSAVQVLGRSTSEKGFKPLIDMISKVAQEIFRVKKQKEFCHSHCPPETISCFREVVGGHPSKTCSLLTPSVVHIVFNTTPCMCLELVIYQTQLFTIRFFFITNQGVSLCLGYYHIFLVANQRASPCLC